MVMPTVLYGEDIFVGYRWYEKRNIPVLFPFGSGLSYTTFEYSDIKMIKDHGGLKDSAMLSVTIKNTGSRRGSQVIQIYASKESSAFICPEKELKAFRRVELEPGLQQTVTIEVPCDCLEFYDETHKRWVHEGGIWNLFVATSCSDIIEKVSFTLDSPETAIVYHKLLAAEWFSKNPDIENILKNRSDGAKAFLGPQKEAMGDLICALPVYRMTEDGLFGGKCISPEELAEILDELNQQR